MPDANQGHHGDAQSDDERGGHGPGSQEDQLVAADQLLKLIKIARRPGHHWFVVQMPLNIRREAVGRLVAARAVFFQRFHDDPVQVAAHQMNQFRRLRLAPLRRHRQFPGEHRAQPRRRPRRFVFADRPADFIQPGPQHFFGAERRLAREQFVKQNPQRIDVATRVNVHRAHLRLLRAHVGRGANELLERGEQGLIRQAAVRRLGNAKVNHLGHRHPIAHRHQYIRGF